MHSLEGQRVLVTGGSRGLGLGLTEALVAKKAEVTVLARDRKRLAEVEARLGVRTIAGDIADPLLAASSLRDVRPTVLVLNAGSTPAMAPLHMQTWDAFRAIWDTDVKAGFHWIQEAIRLPLAAGSRVLIGSSGAAVAGSPLSGGYAGAKRMLWMMAHYANGISTELGLGIRFQAIIPQQLVGETDLGRAAAETYAQKRGISVEAFLAGFGKPMTPRDFGEHLVTILTDEKYAGMTAIGLKGDTGIRSLDT
jgi:NAD(P)-dependent dehydrogenase (short-subunit alcohol dehydrogenase family)